MPVHDFDGRVSVPLEIAAAHVAVSRVDLLFSIDAESPIESNSEESSRLYLLADSRSGNQRSSTLKVSFLCYSENLPSSEQRAVREKFRKDAADGVGRLEKDDDVESVVSKLLDLSLSIDSWKWKLSRARGD